MDDFASDTDSDYTSYWRDWVSIVASPDRVPCTLSSLHASSMSTKCRQANSSVQFLAARGNEYFCEIDEDYLTDRFNLTGLNTDIPLYQYALDLVTDVFDMDVDDDMREQIERSARHLYGMVHARYIVTTRGLAKMVSVLKLQRGASNARLILHRWKSTNKVSLANALA